MAGANADLADDFLKLYPAGSDAQAGASACELPRRIRLAYARPGRNCSRCAERKAYLNYLTHVPPGHGVARGDAHGRLAYMFNEPPANDWTDVDRKLADTMSSYWVNFAATGNPNGKGLPEWPAFNEKKGARTCFRRHRPVRAADRSAAAGVLR